MKKNQQVEDIFSLFKQTLGLIGIETLVSLLEAYEQEEVSYEEVLERVEEYNTQFDLSEFLKTKGQRVRSESIKLGESYYSATGIVSLGKDSYYNFEDSELKYRIILNPTTSEIIKLLYANIPILQFLDEMERDIEFNYLVDKLNLLGIRHITIR